MQKKLPRLLFYCSIIFCFGAFPIQAFAQPLNILNILALARKTPAGGKQIFKDLIFSAGKGAANELGKQAIQKIFDQNSTPPNAKSPNTKPVVENLTKEDAANGMIVDAILAYTLQQESCYTYYITTSHFNKDIRVDNKKMSLEDYKRSKESQCRRLAALGRSYFFTFLNNGGVDIYSLKDNVNYIHVVYEIKVYPEHDGGNWIRKKVNLTLDANINSETYKVVSINEVII